MGCWRLTHACMKNPYEQEKGEPITLASALVGNMQNFPEALYLAGPARLFEVKEAAVRDLVEVSEVVVLRVCVRCVGTLVVVFHVWGAYTCVTLRLPRREANETCMHATARSSQPLG